MLDCIFVALGNEPRRVVEATVPVQAIVAVIFLGHGNAPAQRELSITLGRRQADAEDGDAPSYTRRGILPNLAMVSAFRPLQTHEYPLANIFPKAFAI